jgi:hypothetical protein
MSRFALGLVCVVIVGAMAAQVEADILYNDTFTGSNGTPLNGHTPDITTGGASWAAFSGYTLQGNAAVDSAATPNDVSWDGAALPFIPDVGKVYTLSVDVTVPSGVTTNWVGFGFSKSHDLNNDACAWVLQRDNGETYITPGDGTNGITETGYLTAGTKHSYSVVLDTRAATWSAQMYADGSQLGSTLTNWTNTGGSPGNPSITCLGIWSQNYTGGQFDNLTLSSAIPEPSSLALLAMGIFGLLCYAWRKRK